MSISIIFVYDQEQAAKAKAAGFQEKMCLIRHEPDLPSLEAERRISDEIEGKGLGRAYVAAQSWWSTEVE